MQCKAGRNDRKIENYYEHINSSDHVKPFYEVVSVRKFRFEPRKIRFEKNYIFHSNANINYLSEQLVIIDEFEFTAKEQMYTEAGEFKAKNDTAGLKRVNDLIKAYSRGTT